MENYARRIERRIEEILNENNINRSQLAKKQGLSKQAISQRLNQDFEEITIRGLTGLGEVLEHAPLIFCEDQEVIGSWEKPLVVYTHQVLRPYEHTPHINGRTQIKEVEAAAIQAGLTTNYLWEPVTDWFQYQRDLKTMETILDSMEKSLREGKKVPPEYLDKAQNYTKLITNKIDFLREVSEE